MHGEIQKNLKLIREAMPPSLEEFKGLGLVKDGIYKRLEFAIGLLLEGLMELAREKDVVVFSYGEAINELEAKGIIQPEIAEKARFLVQLREVLIYDYDVISDEIAFRDMEEYLSYVEDVLEALRGAGR